MNNKKILTPNNQNHEKHYLNFFIISSFLYGGKKFGISNSHRAIVLAILTITNI
jgi:hypothetical protein